MNEELFIPVGLESFRDDSLRTFDIYFETKSGHKSLYCAMGDRLSEEVRETLHEQHEIQTLYVKKNDIHKYEQYISMVLKLILGEPGLDVDTKMKIAYDSIKITAESLFKRPKADIIQRYRKVIVDTFVFIVGNDHAMQSLIRCMTTEYSIHNHSVNVGILGMGLILGSLTEKPGNRDQDKVTGFYLHDIGRSSIPYEILHKKGPLSRVEWKIVQRHPLEGCKILEELGELTEVREVIVRQHHERRGGKGYPGGLNSTEIHPAAKMCAMADVFDGLTSSRPYRDACSTFTALKIMKDEMHGEFDPKMFARFITMLSA